MFPNEKLLGYNDLSLKDESNIERWVFSDRKTLNGLEDTPDSMCIEGKTCCDVVFPKDVLDNLGILNVNGEILFFENRIEDPDPPIDVNSEGVDTATFRVGSDKLGGTKQHWLL